MVSKIGEQLIESKEALWSRLKLHFTDSFSGELLQQRREQDHEQVAEVRGKRRRHAYRYVLLLAVILLAAPVALTQYDRSSVTAIGISMGLTWLVSALLVFAMTAQSRRLRDMAITDSLTGAFNRRYLELQAGKALQDWERYRRSVSMLLLDLDHFKRVNDKFGHAIGDAVLQRLVNLIQQRIRKVDTLCRFGGEEFMVLLSETTAQKALYVAEELRGAVEREKLLPQGSMTISVGVCDVTQVQDMEHWFRLVDAALYQAKHNGRNRVELALPLSDAATAIAPTLPAKTLPDWR